MFVTISIPVLQPRKIILLLLGLCTQLGSCASPPALKKPPVIHSVQEAASIHVTTLSIARWEDYVNALQAQFTLTADGAYGLALPQTSLSQTSLADSLGLGLQIGLPQSARTQSQGFTGSQGTNSTATTAVNQGVTTNSNSVTTTGDNTTTNSSTSTRTPGVAPASTLPAQSALSNTGIAGLTGSLQSDPILSYTAATAIYQEVQQLNRYLQDGALRYGYVPYVARLQASVMPFARNEPYDIYLDVGLFSKCEGGTEALPVIVVPLLVTDDIEKGQGTNAENVARQLALSVAGVVSSVGLGSSITSLRDNFKSILADNFNSVFMVSRGADNVLELRFGAATSPATDAGYAMLAQTHNLSFVLLVKREYAAVAGGRCAPSQTDLRELRVHGTGVSAGPIVQVTTHARLRDATTGKEVPIDQDARFRIARQVLKEYTSKPQSEETLNDLVAAIQDTNPETFRNALAPDLVKYWQTLWTALTSANIASEYTGSHFNLPYRSAPRGIEAQTVIIHDDCKTSATTSIVGFRNAVAGQFSATLELGDGAFRIAATTLTQSTPGAPISITFPTLNEVAQDESDIKSACTTSSATPNLARTLSGAKLIVREVADERWVSAAEREDSASEGCIEQCEFEFRKVIMDGTAQVAQNVGLSAAADTIVADGATGTGKIRLLLKIDKGLDSVSIALSGAQLAAPPTLTGAATASLTGGGITVTPAAPSPTSTPTPGAIVLDVSLQGLVVGRAVSISGTGQKDQKPTSSAVPVIVLPITAAPAAAKAAASTATSP